MFMDGEVVYLFVYDVGAKFTEEQLKGLLKNPEDFSYEYRSPPPRRSSRSAYLSYST